MEIRTLNRSREINKAANHYSTRMSQILERLIGAAFNGSIMNDFVTRGPGYFFKQGYKGWSDGTFIFNDRRINEYTEIAEIEVKILDCSNRSKQEAFESLCKGRPVQEFFNLCVGKGRDGSNKGALYKDRARYWVLIAGFHQEDVENAWLKVDPSIFTGLIVIGYKRIELEGGLTEYKKAIKKYNDFDSFAYDVLISETFDEYFESKLADISKNEIFELFYNQEYLLLRDRLFDRMQFLKPQRILDRVALREFMTAQIKVGIENALEDPNGILLKAGIDKGDYLKDFLRREWIKEHEGKYQVYFERIIQDLFKSSAETAARALGLPIR